MSALFHVLMLVGILIGLATQGVARAAEPCPIEHVQFTVIAMAGMENCCPADGHKSHEGTPCGEMALACQAMPGCAALGTLDAAAMTDLASQGLGEPQFWILAPALHGRATPPEIHPPALLG